MSRGLGDVYKRQDYDAFYEQEIMYRELMDYPPVSNLLTVKVSSKNEQLANDIPVWLLQETTKELRKIYYDEDDMPRAIGPSRASVYKLNDIFSVLLFCYSCFLLSQCCTISNFLLAFCNFC